MTVGLRLRQVGAVLLRAALLLLISSLVSGIARAEAPSWLRPLPQEEDCLIHEEVRLSVEASWTVPPPADVSVQIRRRPENGFLIYRGEEAKFERTFQYLPADCRARQEAYVVAIVVAMDHLLQAEKPVDQTAPLRESVAVAADDANAGALEGPPENEVAAPAPSGAASPGASSSSDEPDRLPPDEKSRPPLRGRVSLSAGPLLLVLPKTALASQLRTELLLGRFSAGIEFLRAWPVTSALDGGTVRSHLWGLGISTCVESDTLPIGTGLCLLALGGSMGAEASGLSGSGSSERSYWGSGGVGGVIRFPARRKWGVEIAGNIFGNFLRPGVAVDVRGGPDREDNAPVVGYRTSLGGFFVLP